MYMPMCIHAHTVQMCILHMYILWALRAPHPYTWMDPRIQHASIPNSRAAGAQYSWVYVLYDPARPRFCPYSEAVWEPFSPLANFENWLLTSPYSELHSFIKYLHLPRNSAHSCKWCVCCSRWFHPGRSLWKL